MSVFENKVALVTGAGAGIGRALCLALAREGAVVEATGRRLAPVEETADLVRGLGARASARALDVSQKEAVEEAVAETARRHGRLDYLFNNAGISIAGEVRDLCCEDFRKVIDVNLMGTLHGTLAAYQVMADQGHGHIVNISSLAGLLPFPVKAPYSATKHAVVGLSVTLRAEAEALGVKVTAVCPGLVNTDIWEKTPIRRARNDDIKKIVRAPMMSAEKAARVTLKGVEKNKAVVTFPFSARLLWMLYRIHPAILDPLGRKMMSDFRRIKD